MTRFKFFDTRRNFAQPTALATPASLGSLRDPAAPGLSAFTGGLSMVTIATSRSRVSLTGSFIKLSGHAATCRVCSGSKQTRLVGVFPGLVYMEESSRPPSTTSVCPVMKDERSLARSAATSAISRGWPKWRMG